MDDQPGRLVDDQQVVVLVDDVERDLRRGLELERRRARDVEPQRPSPAPTIALALSGLAAAVSRPSEMSFWT